MNSKQIQQAVFEWALNHEPEFNAPYGVLEGEGKSSKGTKYLEVTFGYSRTLDMNVQIYNSKFIIVYSNRNRNGQKFKSYEELMQYLNTI